MDTVQDRKDLAPTIFARQWFATLLRIFAVVKIRRKRPNLFLCETLALGERRLIAVVQWEDKRYLIGATQNSLSILDRREPPADSTGFASHFTRHAQQPGE